MASLVCLRPWEVNNCNQFGSPAGVQGGNAYHSRPASILRLPSGRSVPAPDVYLPTFKTLPHSVCVQHQQRHSANIVYPRAIDTPHTVLDTKHRTHEQTIHNTYGAVYTPFQYTHQPGWLTAQHYSPNLHSLLMFLPAGNGHHKVHGHSTSAAARSAMAHTPFLCDICGAMLRLA